MVSKYYSPLKGTQTLWRNGWFQFQGKKYTRWSGDILLSQKIRTTVKTTGPVKGQRRQMKGLSLAKDRTI